MKEEPDMQKLNEGNSPAPTPAEPKAEPRPSDTISREQIERDTYDVRKKSDERLVNVAT